MKLTQVWGEYDDVLRAISLLAKVTQNFEYDSYLECILLRRLGPSLPRVGHTLVLILRVSVGEENDVVLQATDVWTILRLVGIDKVRVGQLTNEVGDFWAHTMLLAEGLVWIVTKH